MMYVNHNMERAMKETTRDRFDFQNTKNQFVTTSKASMFQKTMMNSLHGRRLSSYAEDEISGDG